MFAFPSGRPRITSGHYRKHALFLLCDLSKPPLTGDHTRPFRSGRTRTMHALVRRLSVSAASAAVAVLLVTAPVADARDTHQTLPLESALAKAQASGKLAPGVKLF